MPLSPDLLSTLADLPRQVETLFRQVPPLRHHWMPASWEGVPGERFSAVGHLCHLRDIEVDGYHVRIQRTLDEHHPDLLSVDGYRLAEERHYAQTAPDDALAAFRDARARTVARIAELDEHQLARPARFGEHGDTTLRGLIHYLCSHDQQHLACLHWLLGRIHA